MIRFLWLVGFSLWIGGFVFYASFVVPITRRELGETGVITRHVAPIFNNLGALVLSSWFCALLLEWRQPAWRRTALALLIANALILAALFAAYPWVLYGMEHLPDAEFRPRHRLYLWLHTVQFFLAVASLAVSLRRWQLTDRESRLSLRECAPPDKQTP